MGVREPYHRRRASPGLRSQGGYLNPPRTPRQRCGETRVRRVRQGRGPGLRQLASVRKEVFGNGPFGLLLVLTSSTAARHRCIGVRRGSPVGWRSVPTASRGSRGRRSEQARLMERATLVVRSPNRGVVHDGLGDLELIRAMCRAVARGDCSSPTGPVPRSRGSRPTPHAPVSISTDGTNDG
jgi:hypothetical protein